MHKLFSCAAAALFLTSSAAFAAPDAPDDTKGLESSPANQTTLQSSQTMSSELQDGSKIEVSPDGSVAVFNANGTKTTPPDGALTLKDGTTITIKDGKKV